jgi:D-3-phosphoglycerate dehydrogenase
MKPLPDRPLRIMVMTDVDTDAFRQHGVQAEYASGGWLHGRDMVSQEQIVQQVNVFEADVLLVEVENVTGAVIEQCPTLAVIGSLRSNPVNIDVAAARAAGVTVLFTPGRNANAVAELAVCLMIDVLRSVSFSYRDMRVGLWGEKQDDPYLRYRGNELGSRTVGILGFGAVGQRVAKLLGGFGSDILAYDPYQEERVFAELGARKVTLETLLSCSDVVTVHLPMNSETRNLLGSRELAQMKEGAVLINTARAHVIDHNALVEALTGKRLRAAALDVHYDEPPQGDPLLSLPNVLFTPHIGGATYEVIRNGSEMIAADLSRLLNGERPRHAAI